MMALRCAPRPCESRWVLKFSIERAVRKLLLDEGILAQLAPHLTWRTIFRFAYKDTRWKIVRFFQQPAYDKEFGPPRIFKFSRGKDVGSRRTHDAAPKPAPRLVQDDTR